VWVEILSRFVVTDFTRQLSNSKLSSFDENFSMASVGGGSHSLNFIQNKICFCVFLLVFVIFSRRIINQPNAIHDRHFCHINLRYFPKLVKEIICFDL